MRSKPMIPIGFALAACAAATPQDLQKWPPLALHPENPRYFMFRGKPTILITSGEHYGAVLNLDFDYVTYLDTLRKDGLNHTRTWYGTYREIPGSFGITDNTLAPAPGRYACPWARSQEPGYSQGGNKFDLTKWDDAFFKRLKDFMKQASRRGIVVELNLWCPNYDNNLWKASPMNAANNVNGVGNCPANEVYTLKHKDLLAVQEAATRKVVQELRDFDNLYYEICNEPYFGGVTMEWQHRIADVIAETEKDFPHKHLISMNIANGRAKVANPHPAVSIFNFHYCHPPDVVEMNRHLNKPIGENETGFRGRDDVLYRTEGWDFIIAGGALYNNLDYSFTSKVHDGTFLQYKSPGGGSPALRSQLRILKDFIHGFDFIRMAPDKAAIKGGPGGGLSARALSEPGKQYAFYVFAPFGGQDFSVRWTGFIETAETGRVTFHIVSDDGARLWIDDKLVIDDWAAHGEKESQGTVDMEAGKKVPIRLEYHQGGGGAVARLLWSTAGQKKVKIPKSRLFLPDGSGNGLKGEYFEGKDFKKLKKTRADGPIDFNWSNKGPFPREGGELKAELILDLPAGRYRAEWVNTKTGAVDRREDLNHAGGERTLASPPFADDIALRVVRK